VSTHLGGSFGCDFTCACFLISLFDLIDLVGFFIKLNFVIFKISKCVNYNYSKYSFIHKFNGIFSNFKLSYIFKY
jgi:hypothetical protein